MATYFLDTGILIGILRGAPYGQYVLKTYAPTETPNICMTSIVNVAELQSLALRRGWGKEKLSRLDELLRRIPRVSIQHESVLRKWVEIDAFNHGKHPDWALEGSSHTMGDNDMWTAATASVLKANLLTTDHDFDHLDNRFLPVIYVDQKSSV